MKKLYLIVCCLFISAGLWGQVTTSTMSGKITSTTGEELIGATVVATHVPTGSEYGAITNVNGVFNIVNMRSGGPYKVTISYIGYETETVEGIYLALGSGANVDVALAEAGTILDEIVVSGAQDPVINSSRTGASTNLNNETINSLPTISRSINDFTRMTPQSVGNSFAGTSSRFNNYTIDGNIYNNNFGLGADQFAGGNPVSLDAIEQVSVNLAPYDVRYSGFTGASVDAVTRSGTNRFEGSAYYFLRNDQMIGNKVGDISANVNDSEITTYGFRIGGPIIKDRLFFFASYEKEDQAVPSFTKRAAREGETPDGINISRVPLSEANRVRERMRELYGYETGAPDSYPFAEEAERFNLRFDYNINRNHKVSLRFNHFTAFRDVPTNGNSIRFVSTRYFNTSRQGIENINFRNNNYTQEREVTSIVAELNSVLGDNLSNQLNVGFTSSVPQRRGIPGGQNFPMIEVLEPNDAGELLYYMTMGNELFSVFNLLENDVFNITNTLTHYAGRHTITAGVNFEYMTFNNAFNPTFHGWYRYIGFDKFEEAVLNQNPNVHPDAYARSFALDGSTTPPLDETSFGQVGVFIQDQYQVNPDLSVTAGLRVDMPFYPIDLPRNELLDEKNKTFTGPNGTFTPDVSTFPKVNPLFSPRLGFNWDVFGDRSLQLRGGSGLFSGRIPFVWLSNQVNGSGVVRGGIGFEGQEVVDAGIIFNPDVNAYLPENPEIELSNEINLTDEDFKLPQVWRTSIGADYQLPLGLMATVDFIYNRDVHTPVAYNPVLRNPDRTLSGPDQRGYWVAQEGLTAYSNDPDFRNVFLLTNAEEKADYFSATIQLRKSFDSGFDLMAAYTYSQSRDLDAAGGSQAISLWPQTVQRNRNNPELGFAGHDQPNRLMGALSYRAGNTTIGLFYDAGNAGRFSYTYSGNFGDGSNRLIYIPNNASELVFEEFTLAGETITAQRQQELFDAYIDQDDYLSSNRGKIAERNGAVRPWVHRFDLRILQDINLAGDGQHRLQLSLDFTNVGNMLNSDWGVPQLEYQRNLLNLRRITDEGVPVYRLNTISGTNEFPTETFRPTTTSILANTWRMQVGVRYIFGS
ncbi:MAG: TonB-dependent receptor [Saprospirales bacterium]|nr:MAG: TonB-dependent receptor [Saprospirales bacterium]